MKTVWVDIGTHTGQELRAALSRSPWFYWKIFKFLMKFLLPSLPKARRLNPTIPPPRPQKLRRLALSRKFIRGRLSEIITILVEPNPELYQGRVYRAADHVFPLALTEEGTGPRLTRLYYANHNRTGQGSSVYPQKKNVSVSDFRLIASMSAKSFFA